MKPYAAFGPARLETNRHAPVGRNSTHSRRGDDRPPTRHSVRVGRLLRFRLLGGCRGRDRRLAGRLYLVYRQLWVRIGHADQHRDQLRQFAHIDQ